MKGPFFFLSFFFQYPSILIFLRSTKNIDKARSQILRHTTLLLIFSSTIKTHWTQCRCRSNHDSRSRLIHRVRETETWTRLTRPMPRHVALWPRPYDFLLLFSLPTNPTTVLPTWPRPPPPPPLPWPFLPITPSCKAFSPSLHTLIKFPFFGFWVRNWSYLYMFISSSLNDWIERLRLLLAFVFASRSELNNLATWTRGREVVSPTKGNCVFVAISTNCGWRSRKEEDCVSNLTSPAIITSDGVHVLPSHCHYSVTVSLQESLFLFVI